jgi:2-amino-4-hydroxy-6-hydroxymethyldihydropteridine diphosphokinase
MIALGPSTIAIGLGGNLGTDAELLARFADARAALAAFGRIASAPVYRSAPIGPPQPAYLNTAIAMNVEPAPEPRELIETLRELERLAGRDRDREVRWGPRMLDLDVLLWGVAPIRTPELTVPHPRLVARRFALRPLSDVIADVIVPGTERTIAGWLATTADQELDVVAYDW